MPAGGGLFLSLCHPSSPLQLILTSRWIVAQSGKCDTPHIFLWICHFTYHRLTSRYRHNERRNGDIIPVRFGGGTVITHLSICCHQRKENDCVSGDERQNQSKPNMCERVVYDWRRLLHNCCLHRLSSKPKKFFISISGFSTASLINSSQSGQKCELNAEIRRWLNWWTFKWVDTNVLVTTE